MNEITPTEQQIQELIAGRLKIPADEVPVDRDLLEEIGLDSFDLMDAVLEIEELFPPVSLSDKDAEELRTIRDLATFIDRERDGAVE